MTWQVHAVLATCAATITGALKFRHKGQHRADPLTDAWPRPLPAWAELPGFAAAEAVAPVAGRPPWELAHDLPAPCCGTMPDLAPGPCPECGEEPCWLDELFKEDQ